MGLWEIREQYRNPKHLQEEEKYKRHYNHYDEDFDDEDCDEFEEGYKAGYAAAMKKIKRMREY